MAPDELELLDDERFVIRARAGRVGARQVRNQLIVAILPLAALVVLALAAVLSMLVEPA